MAIKNFFLLSLCLANFISYSQSLKIDITLDSASNEYVYLRKNNERYKVNIPYILIKYNNFTDTDIYLKKIVTDDDVISYREEEAVFLIPHMLAEFTSGRAKSIRIDTYPTDKKFFINIGNAKQEYLIENNGLFSFNLYQIQPVNCDSINPLFFDQIGLLKEILNAQNYLNSIDSSKEFVFFDYPNKMVIPFSLTGVNDIGANSKNLFLNDSTRTFPVEQFENQFVFLKKNEVYTQRINILALLLIGGTYNLSLEKYKLENYIKIYNDKIPDFIKFKLPDKFRNYKLYTGDFETHSASAIFDNKKGVIILGSK